MLYWPEKITQERKFISHPPLTKHRDLSNPMRGESCARSLVEDAFASLTRALRNPTSSFFELWLAQKRWPSSTGFRHGLPLFEPLRRLDLDVA